MKSKTNLFLAAVIYTFILWILTSVISSVIIMFFESWNNYSKRLFTYVLNGLISSSPSLVLFCIITVFVTRNKWILALISVLLIFISFYIVLGDLIIRFPSFLTLPIIFSLVSSILVIVFNKLVQDLD